MKDEDNIYNNREFGRWLETGYYVTTASGHLDVYKCSACKNDITLDDYDSYCPNCGAEMLGYGEFNT